MGMQFINWFVDGICTVKEYSSVWRWDLTEFWSYLLDKLNLPRSHLDQLQMPNLKLLNTHRPRRLTNDLKVSSFNQIFLSGFSSIIICGSTASYWKMQYFINLIIFYICLSPYLKSALNLITDYNSINRLLFNCWFSIKTTFFIAFFCVANLFEMAIYFTSHKIDGS